MRKGISPIVSVVILIAAAVIIAVAIYFWMGGLVTKEQSPKAPRTIQAWVTECGDDDQNYTVLKITNTSPKGIEPINTRYDLLVVGGSGDEILNGSYCNSSIVSGGQISCRIQGFVRGDGSLVIYGRINKQISSSTVKC